LIELVISYQKVGSRIVVKDKIVHCQKVQNVIRVLGNHGYHVLTYHTNAPKEDIQIINIGGYTDETEQSREVC
jgi:hypothetical protein